MHRILSAVVIFAFLFDSTANAELQLAALFSDSMVIQRDQPVKVWGWATAGSKVIIDFKFADGLMSKTDKLEGFVICGPDKKFVWADATIDGNSVIVSSKPVSEPLSVRYAWAVNPKFSLFIKAGIPASPFRTDEWQEQSK